MIKVLGRCNWDSESSVNYYIIRRNILCNVFHKLSVNLVQLHDRIGLEKDRNSRRNGKIEIFPEFGMSPSGA